MKQSANCHTRENETNLAKYAKNVRATGTNGRLWTYSHGLLPKIEKIPRKNLQNQKIVMDKKVWKNAYITQKSRQKYVKKKGEIGDVVEMHKGGRKVKVVFVQSYKFATCGGKIAKNG